MFRHLGLEFWVWGFGVLGLGFRDWGLRFGLQGLRSGTLEVFED